MICAPSAPYQEQPGDFAVALTRLVQSEPSMRVGDTLFMRPFVGSVAVRYLPAVARDAEGLEFLTEYDTETFKRNGWRAVAFTVAWVPRARTEVLAVIDFDRRPTAAEQVTP